MTERDSELEAYLRRFRPTAPGPLPDPLARPPRARWLG